MKNWISVFVLLMLILPWNPCTGQTSSAKEGYSYQTGDRNGIGKWYMHREIAHVMGHQGMRWLDRPERDSEENTTKLLDNMDIQIGDTIADIGAGSGYHVFLMADLAKKGLVYAVDIQDEMLAEIQRKKEKRGTTNVRPLKGSEKSVPLPENSVDKLLLVDVYHEFSYPIEMMQSLKKALRPNGKLFLIEYRGEDDRVPIKRLHKMTESQAVKEMQAAGFTLERNMDNLPWQHCMVFMPE